MHDILTSDSKDGGRCSACCGLTLAERQPGFRVGHEWEPRTLRISVLNVGCFTVEKVLGGFVAAESAWGCQPRDSGCRGV